MTTIFLERTKRCYAGFWRSIDIRLYDQDGKALIVGRSAEGEPQFEFTEETIDAALDRLCAQEDAERVVLHDSGNVGPPGRNVTRVHVALASRPLPPEQLGQGQLMLPELRVPHERAQAGQRIHVFAASDVLGLEYLRVGTRSGSVVTLNDGSTLFVHAEPGVVLMRIFHASAEDAKRLRPDLLPDAM